MDELLAAIYDAPDDDAPRRRYAEFLTAHGDPRGEHITLQLAAASRTLKKAEAARAAALLAEHRDAWLGGLANVIGGDAVFERGFFADGMIGARDDTGWRSGGGESYTRLPGDWQRAIGDPAWSTVRTLSVECVEAEATRLLEHPVTRHLRALRNASPSLLGVLARSSTPRALEYAQLNLYDVKPPDPEAVIECPALPSLRRIDLVVFDGDPEVERAGWMFDGALGQRLETLRFSLVFGYFAEHFGAWAQRLEKLPLKVLAAGPEDSDWNATLVRGKSGKLDTFEVRWMKGSGAKLSSITRAVKSFAPGTLRRLRVSSVRPITPKPRELAELQAAIRAARIRDVVLLESP